MAMPSSRWAFNTGIALYRVFIAPIEHSPHRASQIQRLNRAPAPKLYPVGRSQKRDYASLPPSRSPPRDGEIRDRMVHIVTEDGLTPPQYTSHVFQSFDPRTHTLIMVAPSPDPSSGEAREWPICRIMERKAFYERQKAKTKKKDNPASIVKTVELNWAIAPHDLTHRLERMQGFLAKGLRVDVLMAGRRKGRKATEEEMDNVLAQVMRALAGVEGAREWKPMDKTTAGLVTLYAEGKKAVT